MEILGDKTPPASKLCRQKLLHTQRAAVKGGGSALVVATSVRWRWEEPLGHMKMMGFPTGPEPIVINAQGHLWPLQNGGKEMGNWGSCFTPNEEKHIYKW